MGPIEWPGGVDEIQLELSAETGAGQGLGYSCADTIRLNAHAAAGECEVASYGPRKATRTTPSVIVAPPSYPARSAVTSTSSEYRSRFHSE